MGEQVSVAEVAAGLRELAATLESGELGEELAAVVVSHLLVFAAEVQRHRYLQFLPS